MVLASSSCHKNLSKIKRFLNEDYIKKLKQISKD